MKQSEEINEVSLVIALLMTLRKMSVMAQSGGTQYNRKDPLSWEGRAETLGRLRQLKFVGMVPEMREQYREKSVLQEILME